MDEWVCEEEKGKEAGMRASSERTDAFLRDGGVARAGARETVFQENGARASSAFRKCRLRVCLFVSSSSSFLDLVSAPPGQDSQVLRVK